MTDTTTATTTTLEFVELDPATLAVHPNVRHDLGDLTDLTRSVKAIGVRVPAVVVRGDDGEFLLVYGQRRRAAAAAAGRPLPALVSAGLDEAERIVDQLAENQHRKALLTSEEGRAYQLLADEFGLSDATIAKRTGVTRRRVEKVRRIASSDAAAAVADDCGLTLDQVLVFAEFDGDDDALARLTDTARQRPSQFDHLASRLRYDRDLEERHAAAVAALEADGVTVLSDDTDAPSAAPLWRLRDGDDDITPETHRDCPGHAADVSYHDPDRVTYVCVDPDAYGHRDIYGAHTTASSTGGPRTDEQKPERRVVIENNKQWRAAVDVRRAHVRALLSRSKAPKGTLRYVTGEIVGHPDRVGDGKEEMVADLLGVERRGGYGRSVGAAYVAKGSEAQLPLALFLQVAADREQTMNEHTWRQPSPDAARYFAFLASTGYALADIEQLVVDAAATHEAERAQALAEEAADAERHTSGIEVVGNAADDIDTIDADDAGGDGDVRDDAA